MHGEIHTHIHVSSHFPTPFVKEGLVFLFCTSSTSNGTMTYFSSTQALSSSWLNLTCVYALQMTPYNWERTLRILNPLFCPHNQHVWVVNTARTLLTILLHTHLQSRKHSYISSKLFQWVWCLATHVHVHVFGLKKCQRIILQIETLHCMFSPSVYILWIKVITCMSQNLIVIWTTCD